MMGILGPPNIEKMKVKKDIKGLIKALGYKKDSLVRRAAAKALWQIDNKHAVEPLINALGDKDTDVRKYAANALGKIGDERVVEPLVTSLGAENNGLREAAAFALGEIGSVRALEPLINALGDKDMDVRIHAAKALGKIGDECAVESLVASLGDENNGVREVAAFALGEIGSTQAVNPLMKAFKYENNYYVRMFFVRALGEIDTSRALDMFIEALKDQEKQVRENAAQALAEIGSARALEPLINTLADKDTDVRIYAAKALGEIGDERAVESLVALLDDEVNDVVREAAAFALGKIGSSGMDILISTLVNKKNSARKEVAQALGNISDVRSVETLIVVLTDGDDDRNVRKACAKKLQYMYLTEGLDEETKRRIKSVEWIITAILEEEMALNRAKKWWLGKPDPSDELYICDSCNARIHQTEGTSLIGSYMRCANCTARLFKS